MEIYKFTPLHYSLHFSYRELTGILPYLKKDWYSSSMDCNYMLYYQLGTVLGWISACFERLKSEFQFDEDETAFLRSIQCANNIQKHNVTFYQLHKFTGGLIITREAPCCVFEEIEFVWNSLDDLEKLKYPTQLAYYNKYLKGNDLILSLDRAIKILDKYFVKFCSAFDSDYINTIYETIDGLIIKALSDD